jgi:glycosyltransferase involved in cell wall biosynthesis
MTKVLYLSYNGMTDHLGQSQVLPYLVGLTETYGHAFTLISFEKSEKFAQQQSPIEALCRAVGIRWIPLRYTKRPPILATLKDLMEMARVAADQCRKEDFAIVHCRSYPASLVGLRLQRQFGLKFIFDMRGFYADERLDGSIWKKDSWLHRLLYRYVKRKEREFLEQADCTVSLTQAGQREIHSWNLAGQPLPVEVIPCCADFELFNYQRIAAADSRALRSELGIAEEAFVLSYLGSIGTWYMLDEMLDFFKRLLVQRPDAVFFFLSGESASDIKDAAQQRGIAADRIVVRRADRAEVPLYLSISTLNIFFILPVFSKKASSPTKQAEVMGMGIPIVCNDGVGDTGAILAEVDPQLIVRAFSEADYDAVITHFLTTPSDPERIRAVGQAHFSLDQGVGQYHRIYQAILSKEP